MLKWIDSPDWREVYRQTRQLPDDIRALMDYKHLDGPVWMHIAGAVLFCVVVIVLLAMKGN